jgi:16S rRNA processing protein RimM
MLGARGAPGPRRRGGLTLVTAGRIGRAHGFDGSFWVEAASHLLPLGTNVVVAGEEHEIERRAGTDARPLLRLKGLTDPKRLRGLELLVDEQLGTNEWLAAELVGCEVVDVGTVQRVIDAPSCDVLELDDGTLIPLVTDAVEDVDVRAQRIRVDRRFLGLEEHP